MSMTDQELKDVLDKMKQIKYEPNATLIDKLKTRALFYADNNVDNIIISLCEIKILWETLQFIKDVACPQIDMFGDLLAAFGKIKDEK